MKYTTDKIDGTAFYGMSGADTALVLFFLSLEYGRGMRVFSVDAILMAITMLMVLVLPYFLPSRYERPEFGNWLAARGALMMSGILSGVALAQSVGVYLPLWMKFVPMAFLIAAAILSCYIQCYGLMKLHLAK